MVFFEEGEKDGKVEDVTKKKVVDFFKCLKKFPNENGGDDAVSAEPFLLTRSIGLPPKWDGPYGTVVLINKPKGWTSYRLWKAATPCPSEKGGPCWNVRSNGDWFIDCVCW